MVGSQTCLFVLFYPFVVEMVYVFCVFIVIVIVVNWEYKEVASLVVVEDHHTGMVDNFA